MKLARIVAGVIAEFPQAPEGFTLEESFHPDFLATLVEVPYACKIGWVQQGGAFIPPPLPPPGTAVFPPVTRRQLRLTLLAHGLLDQIEPAIAALEEPQRSVALIEWQDANAYHRDHPLIAQLSSALGLAEENVNALWQEAMSK